jgi:hypothetical protein
VILLHAKEQLAQIKEPDPEQIKKTQQRPSISGTQGQIPETHERSGIKTLRGPSARRAGRSDRASFSEVHIP